MDGDAAGRTATMVGISSGAIGAALLRAPGGANRVLGLAGDGNGAMRMIALADIAVAPGLVRARPQWPWMVARAGLNVAIAQHFLRRRAASSSPARPLLVVLALGGLTVGDLRVAAALRAAGA